MASVFVIWTLFPMDGAALEFGMSKPVTALRLISSGLFCHSNLRSDIETSYENPTTETNYEYLRGDIWNYLICREGFTAGHDPPASQGLWSLLQPDVSHSRPRQTQHSMALGDHRTLWFLSHGPEKLTLCSVPQGFREWVGVSEPSSVVTELPQRNSVQWRCKGAAITPGVPGRLQLQSICSEGLDHFLTTSQAPQRWPFPWNTV